MRIRLLPSLPGSLLAALLLLAGGLPASGADGAAARAAEPISWQTPEGLRRLQRSRAMADFQPLANNYEAQKNAILCGPTSATIVLNSLRGRGRSDGNPVDPETVPAEAYQYLPEQFDPLYPRYTQNTFFNERTDRIKTLMQVYGQPLPGTEQPDYGLQLRQLHGMLLEHDTQVTLRVVDGSQSRRAMLEEIVGNLHRPDDYVIVNFARAALGQPGGGHFSPVGAYDRRTRSFLVLDVTPLVSDWFWVSADLLFDAMATFDTIENRGYLLISEEASD